MKAIKKTENVEIRDADKSRKTMDLHNNEFLVDSYLDAVEKISEAEHQKNEVRKHLDREAIALRREASRLGIYVPTITAHGTNKTAVYQFRNAFKTLPTPEEHRLREVVGELYDDLFEERKSLTMKKGVTEGQLRDALGDDFDKYFESSTEISPVKNFRERIFVAEGFVDDDSAQDLHDLEDEVCHRPQLKTK